jgi:hypothetical protein
LTIPNHFKGYQSKWEEKGEPFITNSASYAGCINQAGSYAGINLSQ